MVNNLHNYFNGKDKVSSRRMQGKRMLADYDNCKLELNKEIPLLFAVYGEALEKTNKVLSLLPPHCRSRSLEASIIQSCFAESLLENFRDKAFFGKYRRLILRVKGYLILFKKLDRKGYPMNIKTVNVQSILNQNQTLDLFSESDYRDDPILYFGYKKNKVGEYVDPQLIYIDESNIKFSITGDDISANLPTILKEGRREVKPTLKEKSTLKKIS